ncbi:MAG: RDD family protein [Pseudomonadota bacterium]
MSAEQGPGAPRYVGFWARFVAFLVDSVVALAVIVPLLLAVHSPAEWQRLSASLEEALAKAASGVQVDVSALVRDTGFSGPLDVLIQVVLPIAALLAFWKFRNSSPGKMLFGARIADADTGKPPSDARLLARFLGYFVSILTLGIGFLWIAIDRRKQGLHDKIARTVVIRE